MPVGLQILFCQTALELLGKNPFIYAVDMYDIYWNTFIEDMKPFEGAVEFVKTLKESGIKTAVCTDMTAHIQFRKLKKLGFSEFIDYIVTSEETGVEKPSPAMFNLALEKLKVEPGEAVYFGDSLERDVYGPAKVGITPFWFTKVSRDVLPENPPYKTFSSYEELDAKNPENLFQPQKGLSKFSCGDI